MRDGTLIGCNGPSGLPGKHEPREAVVREEGLPASPAAGQAWIQCSQCSQPPGVPLLRCQHRPRVKAWPEDS